MTSVEAMRSISGSSGTGTPIRSASQLRLARSTHPLNTHGLQRGRQNYLRHAPSGPTAITRTGIYRSPISVTTSAKEGHPSTRPGEGHNDH